MLLPPAAAQSAYTGALSAGSAFMPDSDDPDPAGSYSVTAALERRRPGKALSFGVEAGVHRYLAMRQDLPPDIAGWASKLEDTRKSWRLTPFVRWGTRGSIVRVYGQVGAGLYVQETAYFQQERVAGELVLDVERASTDPRAGFNLGAGVQLFPGGTFVGIGAGLRSHHEFGRGGDGFVTAELGVVLR
ncbi:MAG: hypothetical protein ACREM9_11455 [Gemmatimonadales bacterium]